MGFFSKPDPNKKVRVWLLVILTFIPIVCCYSFVRVKKFRKMFLINLIFVITFFSGLIVGTGVQQFLDPPVSILSITNLFSLFVLPVIDAIFVWKWSKEHNRQIDQKHLT